MLNQKKESAREKYRATVASAMPEVKALVKKFGRAAVANCLTKIREYDREVGRLEKLKREIAEREAKLR